MSGGAQSTKHHWQGLGQDQALLPGGHLLHEFW